MSPFLDLLRRRKRGDTEGEDDGSVRFRSRGLTFLLEDRSPRAPWRVLDLGEADNINLNFFTSRGAEYAVEGLYRSLEPCRKANSYDVECVRGLEDLLRFRDATCFDLILAWDLFDRLPSGVHELVARRLVPMSHEGTLLYAIVSREPRLPGRPAKCRIVDEETIEMSDTEEPRPLPGPRYTQTQIDRNLDPFRVVRSYLLKIHAQEMILQRT